ncbi:hypothetical protein SAMN04487770_103121 [Butyrivibrio sp. ob235]|uniref:hypothetical protein n=1 Tax=Butyrivibrio sp. ob235 TaxID=1761780 RepID=UPI0008AF729A|nr:hypothetical protein [Butyrivibrio sp. ob235]SEK83527.1 hypothetical protein SAMN04487770_103121 [Butyrivibrio sp. ob235]
MENKKSFPSANSIITGLITIVFAVVMGLLYSYWFDLNDDVLMKDILAGVFTGTPEGHNIQMLYPISFLISLVYKVFGKIDCYGIYLLLCQYVSLFVLVRSFAGVISDILVDKVGHKAPKIAATAMRIICILVVMAVFLTVVGGHFVIVQYTFVVAMMCSAAAVLFFERKDIAATALIILAFLTRSEMTLLMLPFVLLVIFYRFEDDGFFRENGLKKNALPVIAIAAGLIICELFHFAGYSTKDWREFNSFFDSRTEVYDFYQIPSYDENKDFYDSIGLKESEYELLVNYNFGLDDAIDAEKMAEIAAYGKKLYNEKSVFYRLAGCISPYLYRLRSVAKPAGFEYPMTDSPWNIVTWIMYLVTYVMLLLYESKRHKKTVSRLLFAAWRPALLFAGRTLIWLYILVRGRDPIRITHSLYLIEITVLVVLAEEMLRRVVTGPIRERDSESDMPRLYVTEVLHIFAGFCLVAFASMCFWFMGPSLAVTEAECEGRAEYNKAYEELYDYCSMHSDNFYFMDVYTSVAYEDTGYTYSQKMFGESNAVSNVTLMGGWASKSPIEKEKLRTFGLSENMGNAIFDDKALVITDKDTDLEWMKEYYADAGRAISAEKVVEVAGEFLVWDVR